MIKNKKGGKYGNEEFFLHNSSKNCLEMEFIACYGELMPQGPLT